MDALDGLLTTGLVQSVNGKIAKKIEAAGRKAGMRDRKQ